MKPPEDDSWRHRYLRILTGRADDDFHSQEDLQAIEDLIEDKLLRGEVARGMDSIVRGAALVRADDGHTVPTLKGRLFIEDQKAILRSKTFAGRLKSSWPLFSGIVGIFIGWSLGLATPSIQQRLYPQVQQHHGAAPAPNLTQPKPLAAPAAPATATPTKP